MSDSSTPTGHLTRRNAFAAGAAGLLAAQLPMRALACPAVAGPDTRLTIDTAFSPGAVDVATRRVNAVLEADNAALASSVQLDAFRGAYSGGPSWPANLIAAGTPGVQLLPQPPKSAVSEIYIPGPGGSKIRMLILQPPGKARGTYFYTHGGGWVSLRPEDHQTILWKICREAGVAVVCPDYRLAPEHPFPAGPDDVLAAARWLFKSGQTKFTGPFLIGGDSAGGHLAALTLQRLRDETQLMPFVGADLVYGCYDFTLTPSARTRGNRQPLSTSMLEACISWACPDVAMRASPKVSPLFGSVAGLPPALFSIGTEDPLLDDTLFMNQRWRSAGLMSELAIYPGGVHGFDWYPLAIGVQSIDRRIAFLNDRIRSV